MAKDSQGRVLKVGDLVLIAGRIRSIFAGNDWSDLVIVPVEAMPGGERQTLQINGGQCELLEPPEPAASACDEACHEFEACEE